MSSFATKIAFRSGSPFKIGRELAGLFAIPVRGLAGDDVKSPFFGGGGETRHSLHAAGRSWVAFDDRHIRTFRDRTQHQLSVSCPASTLLEAILVTILMPSAFAASSGISSSMLTIGRFLRLTLVKALFREVGRNGVTT